MFKVKFVSNDYRLIDEESMERLQRFTTARVLLFVKVTDWKGKEKFLINPDNVTEISKVN